MSDTVLDRLEREFIESIETSRFPDILMDHFCHKIGPRTTGSPSMRQASQYACEQLREIGVDDVHTEAMDLSSWENAPVCFDVTSPHKQSFDAIEFVYSAAGKVEALLLDGGGGTEAELAQLGNRIKGNVLFVAGRVGGQPGGKTYPMRLCASHACRYGAAAIVVVNSHPGVGYMIESLDCEQGKTMIPVMGVSYEDGQALAGYLQKSSVRVTLETKSQKRPGSCANVVAQLGPTSNTEPVIALSAHMDCFSVNHGAFDNLTGVITLFEITRALSPMQSSFKRNLQLMLFTGHEYGYIGSRVHVERHRDKMDRVALLFNMDGLFDGTAKGASVMWADQMSQKMNHAYAQTPYSVEVRNSFCMSSDYLPFMLAGVPAARPADWAGAFPSICHSHFDTPERVSLDAIRDNAKVHGSMLLRLLTDPQPLPDNHHSPEKIQALRHQLDINNELERYRL